MSNACNRLGLFCLEVDGLKGKIYTIEIFYLNRGFQVNISELNLYQDLELRLKQIHHKLQFTMSWLSNE